MEKLCSLIFHRFAPLRFLSDTPELVSELDPFTSGKYSNKRNSDAVTSGN